MRSLSTKRPGPLSSLSRLSPFDHLPGARGSVGHGDEPKDELEHVDEAVLLVGSAGGSADPAYDG
jgi:hypothetical protein